MTKTHIAYCSKTAEQKVAEVLAQKTNGDLFEIKVVNDNYPNKYAPLIQFAQKEKQENARPEIVGEVENFSDYDTVFIGYPNWWSDMPMPVYTFLEKYDFSNKKVHYFCTHEGSGGVHSKDFAVYGHIAQNDKEQTEKDVDRWLESLGL